MANIQGTVTINEILVLEVDGDPGAGLGTAAPVGSLAIPDSGATFYKKFGAADTDWIDISASTSASPGFTWGRSGAISTGAWLQNDSVPSNISGRTNFLTSAFVKRVFVANEDPDVFTVGVYYHDGKEIGLTLLGTVTTAAARINSFIVNYSVPQNKQIALKIESGSAKNIVCGAIISGSL